MAVLALPDRPLPLTPWPIRFAPDGHRFQDFLRPSGLARMDSKGDSLGSGPGKS